MGELGLKPNPLHQKFVRVRNAPQVRPRRFPLSPDESQTGPSLSPNLPQSPKPPYRNLQRLLKLLLRADMPFNARQSASRWLARTRTPRSENRAHVAPAFSISGSEASLSNLTRRKIFRKTSWPYRMSRFFRLCASASNPFGLNAPPRAVSASAAHSFHKTTRSQSQHARSLFYSHENKEFVVLRLPARMLVPCPARGTPCSNTMRAIR